MTNQKRNGRRVLALCLLLCLLLPFVLTSCQGDGENLPSGMILASGKGDGYRFYVPSGWRVSQNGTLTVANVSLYSTVSLSLAVMESDKSAEEYWLASCGDVTASLTDCVQDEEGYETALGTSPALRYSFHGKRYGNDETYFSCYITKHAGRLFVMTLAANATEFAQYGDTVEVIASDFLFVDGETPATAPLSGDSEGAPEGMMKISRDEICAYSFFVPDTFTVLSQNGYVAAKWGEDDASSVSMTCYYPTSGVSTIAEQFAALEPSYENLLQNYTVLHRASEEDEPVTLGGLAAAKYEFTGDYQGNGIHVLQLFCVKGSYIYVFTFAAEETLYQNHLPTAEDVIGHITF